MLVSVITPCFNSASTIKDTIQSINEQSYPNIEHLFIDGNSTDNTVELISQYAQRNPLVMSEPDLGLYDAMNKGLEQASGEFCMIINSDDIIASPNVIDKLVSTVLENHCDVLYGNVEIYDRESMLTVTRTYRSDKFNKDWLRYGFMPPHPSMFVSKRTYNQIGLFDLEYTLAADFDWIARVFKEKGMRYSYCNELIVKMRDGGISTLLRNKLKMNREIKKSCDMHGYSTSYFKLYSRYVLKALEIRPYSWTQSAARRLGIFLRRVREWLW